MPYAFSTSAIVGFPVCAHTATKWTHNDCIFGFIYTAHNVHSPQSLAIWDNAGVMLSGSLLFITTKL